MTTPLLSIIIPAYNEEKLLPATLQGVQEAATVLPSWEVIVCDNNSTDQTAAVAAAAGVRVVFEPVNQISRARNAGAHAAQGVWILFLDADSVPSRELFTELLKTMQSGTAVGGGALLGGSHAGWQFRCILFGWNIISRLKKDAAGAFFYCRRDAFHAVAGFSQKLFAAEEIELGFRLKKWGRQQGLKFVIITKAKLETSDRKMSLYSRWEFAKFVLRSGFSRLGNLQKREECGIWYDGRR